MHIIIESSCEAVPIQLTVEQNGFRGSAEKKQREIEQLMHYTLHDHNEYTFRDWTATQSLVL